MNQPLWKRMLSYIFEWHIESVSSHYNPHLYVSLKRGRYQLCTANAIYSYGDLYDNFASTFAQLDLDQSNEKRVLLLGFGLGSIPVILEQTFKKNYTYTAVEIDEAVLYLAGKYVVPDLSSNIEIICTDALTFVQQSTDQYDMICMDIFLDDLVPKPFEQIDFLQNLKRLLKPGGILLYNRLAVTKEDKEESRRFFENKFQQVFPSGIHLDLRTNWMLINRPDVLKNYLNR